MLKAQLEGTGEFDKLPVDKKKLLNELCALQDKYQGKLVIADMFQLGMKGKSFSRDMKELHRKDALVEIEYLIGANWNWQSSGKYYVVDEKKTEARQDKHEEWLEERKAAEELKEQVGESFKDAMQTISKNAKGTVAGKKAAGKEKEKSANAKGTVAGGVEGTKTAFVEICKDSKNRITKEKLILLAEENNLPEEEYSSLNTKELIEFLATALCEVPNILDTLKK